MASISLSYADRAKNAQNIRSPIENTVLAISVSIPESTSSTSSSFSSNASSRSSTSSNPGSSTVISSSSTDVDADITAPTTSNSSVIVESDGECNGGQQEQKKRRGREEEVSRMTTRKPSVNVWEQRMNRGSVSSSFTLISSSSKTSTTNSAFIKKDNDPSIVKVRPTSNNWSARPTPASPSRPVSLDLRNSNAWPEVGVGLSSPSKDKGKGKLINEEVSVVQAKLPPSTRMNFYSSRTLTILSMCSRKRKYGKRELEFF
ncbi:hypothetical protein C8J55DRAFT_235809 [Lentinula edodes]|uniref:Uncharacterized protein n=1 Tax=Lentinula lateritia TaxID=40482 RepID=A0A9W8ZU02_9AGAR|nr:hypothetical protein C8J55DRAFT_235809 [Lentinula edodes]